MIARLLAWIRGLFAPSAPQLTGPVGAPPPALPAGSSSPGADGWAHPTGGLGRLTSKFGPRINPVTKQPQVHNGQDIAVPVGTPILAVKAGKVTVRKDDHPIAGRYIIVDHGDGYLSEYLHLSRGDVTVGQTVKQGQIVGLSGGGLDKVTGKPLPGAGRSTGPHLHFIVKRSGSAVDPASVIAALRA